MQNFNQRVQLFLKKHRKQKQHAVIAVLLSLNVIFSVCGSLIMPAVSMTGATDETVPSFEVVQEDAIPLMSASKPANESGYFDIPCTEIPEGGVNFANNITAATITVGDQTAIVPGETTAINVTTDGDSINASFTVTYTIAKSGVDGNTVTEATPCIYYQLPDGISTQGFSGSNLKVTDGEYTGIAGYYSISTDGLIVIQFTKEYIEKKITGSDEFTGYLTFEGTINRADKANGDQSIKVGGITINVDFPTKNFGVDKSYQVKNPTTATGKPTITWTITVDNYYSNDASNSLIGYKLTDERFPKDKSGVKVDPSDAGSWDEGGNFVFSSNPSQTTFTFTEEVSDYAGTEMSVTNTAILKNSNDAEVTHKDATAYLNKTDIVKDGKPDYETGVINNEINWSVTVTNPYGSSLNGYQVQDAVFNDAAIVVKDASGNEVSYTKNGDTITLGADVGKVTITYTTSKDVTSNTAILIYPNNGGTAEATKEVAYTNPYYLKDKTGNYNSDTGLVTWEVAAHAPDNGWGSTDFNNKKIVLNNYTLTDDAFANIKLSDMTISAMADWNGDYHSIMSTSDDGNTVTVGKNNEIYATITKVGNTITVMAQNPYTEGMDVNNVRGIRDVTFTYTTKRIEAGTDGTVVTTTDDGKTYITNSISDNQGHSNTSNPVEVVDRNTISKSLIGESSKTIYNSDISSIGTLNWNVDVVQDTGFSGGDKTLVDVITATNGGAHYITPAQQSSVQVYAKALQNDSYIGPLDSSAYNITFYYITYGTDGSVLAKSEDTSKGANSFEITFNSAIDAANYKYVQVTYQTTADYTNVPDASGAANQTATFSNEASFNGKTDARSYTITKKDDDYVEKLSFSVSKSWVGDTAADRPESITFQLQRKKGDSGTWETIYPNADGTWEVVTPDLTDESTGNDYTYSLSKSDDYGNWQSMTFENLDKETSDHTQLYYYRAVEIDSPEGYNVSYSAENGINGGNFTITNTKPTEPTYPDFEKTAIDGSKSAIAKLNPNDLTKVDVGGKSYYAVGWKVDFKGKVNVYDTLPEGAILLEAYTLGETASWNTWNNDGKLYYPAMFWNNNQWSLPTSENKGNQSSWYEIQDDGRIKFVVEDASYIIYYIGIPVDEVDAVAETTGYTATNKMEYENGNSKEASVLITSSGSMPEDTDLLKKTVNTPYNKNGENIVAQDGRIQYSVIVNPEGKTLSNTDEYDITDTFRVNGYGSLTGTDALNAIDAKLFEVEVENTATGKTLTSSEYQYTVDYKPSQSSIVNIIDDLSFSKTNTDDKVISNVPPNSEITVKFTEKSGNSETDFLGEITIGNNSTIILSQSTIPYVNGVAEYTFKTGGDTADVRINAWKSSDGSYKNSASSVDILSVESEQTIINATAVLHLTVPDETPLKITYTYDLSKGGVAWTQNDNNTVITTSNSVSLDTGNVQASDSKDGTTFSIDSSTAGVTTGSVPQIVKYDINDYSLKLDASFWIAKYDTNNSKWVFASGDPLEKPEGESVERHVFTFDKEATGDAIPEGAQSISIDAAETYKAGFEPNVLYKLVEFKAPGTLYDGYQGMDAQIAAITVPEGDTKYETLEALIKAYLADASAFPSTSPYYPLLKNFISTHYFVYGSGSVTYPADVDTSKVIQVKTGGSLDIPNNRLISIAASKSWSPNVEGASSIEAKLYWSYTKSSKGIPADATEANAADLGLEEGKLQNPVIINTTLPEGVQGPTLSKYTWSNLPSGKDDKPVYYYVQETSYTLHTDSDVEHTSENCTGCTTYTLKDDGTYQDAEGNEGEYKPNYTGNAANKTGTISINNSVGLTIQKIWKNSDNTSMDANEIPVDYIDVNIYGVKENGDRDLFFTKTLRKTDGWKLTLTSQDAIDAGITLSDYDSIRVEEVIADDQVVPLYGYIASYTYSLNGTNGEATIINKNNAPTETSVTVNKVWGDGNDHSTDELTIKLYQSTTYLTASQLENLTADELESIGGVELAEKKITLPISDNWTYTWDNLEYRNADKVPYNYYVLEEWSGLSGDNAYTAVYARTNSTATNTTYTITNSQSGKASVQKKWVNDAGATVSPDVDFITLQLYKRPLKTTETDDSQTTGEIPSSLKVAAVGDSITNGFWTGANPFPTQLKSLLGSGATVENYGNSGERMYDQISKRVSDNTQYYTDMDVMLIMGGINDINAGYWESYSWDYSTNAAACTSKHSELQQSVENMIHAAYANADASGKGKNNTGILIASIPYEDFVDESAKTVKENINYCGSLWALLQELNGGSWKSVDSSMGVTLAQAFENEINNMVDSYNKMLEDVVINLQATYPTLRFVDINGAVNKSTMLYDGVHPNNDGYAEIAQTFYNAIAVYYGASSGTGTSVTAPTGIDKLPDDFYTKDASGNPTTTVDSSKYTYVKDITLTSDSWTSTFDTDVDYAYYVVEKEGSSSIWTATYDNNGVTEGGVVTVSNTRQTEKTFITANKIWIDTAAMHDAVTVRLYQKSGSDAWGSDPIDTQTLSSANSWSYTWDTLDKEDTDGTLYYYKVVEEAVDGYQTTYSVDDDVGVDVDVGIYEEDGINAGTITITNIRTIDLVIKKDWNGDTPTIASVQVKIYRSTTPNIAEIPLMSTTTNTETTTTSTTTLTSTSTSTSISTSKPTSTSVSASISTTQTTTSLSTSSVTTTTDGSGEESNIVWDSSVGRYVYCVNSSNATYLNGVISFNLSVEDQSTIGNGEVEFYFDSDFLSENGISNAKVTASEISGGVSWNWLFGLSVGSLQNTHDVAISNYTSPASGRCGFSLNPTSSTINIKVTVDDAGDDITTTTTTTTSTSSEETTTTTTTTTITTSSEEAETTTTTTTEASPGGDVIVLQKDGDERISVESGKYISSVSVTLDVAKMESGSELHVYLGGWNAQVNIGCSDGSLSSNSPNNVSKVIFDGNKATINFSNNINASCSWNDMYNNKLTFHGNAGTIYITDYTITYATSEIQSLSLSLSASPMLRSASIPLIGAAMPTSLEAEDTGLTWMDDATIITINATDTGNGEWTYIAENLPVYDENGNQYYYWIEEVSIDNNDNQLSYYDVSYSFDDGDNSTIYCINAADLGNGTAIVQNAKKPMSNTMPSTGGVGTKWYTITGTALMGSTSAAYILIRRRRKRCRMR